MQAEVIAALITAIVAIVGSAATWIRSARKDRLDVLSTIVDQLQEEVGRLHSERNDCKKKLVEYDERAQVDRKRITELEDRVHELSKGILVLIEQIVQLGDIPKWRPNGDSKRAE